MTPRTDSWNSDKQTDSGWNPTGEAQPHPGATDSGNTATPPEQIPETGNSYTGLSSGPPRQASASSWNGADQHPETGQSVGKPLFTNDRQLEPQWQARENSPNTDEDMQPHRSHDGNSPETAYSGVADDQQLQQQQGWENSQGGTMESNSGRDVYTQRGRDDAGSDDMTPHGPRRRNDSPESQEYQLGREADPDNWSGKRTLPRSSKDEHRHTYEPD